MAATLNTTLLVIDESKCQQTDVFALVALVIPIEQADAIRLTHYAFMRELQGVTDVFVSMPPELHGSDMLPMAEEPWATNEHRLKCFAHVVGIVNDRRLQVFRVAYFMKSMEPLQDIKELRHDTWYGICFSGLSNIARAVASRSYVIPIMDGLTPRIVGPIAGVAPLYHSMRAWPNYIDSDMTEPEAQNILDPVFVDSEHNALMQLTDVVTYLLHVLDWERQGLEMSAFKAQVAAIAHTLDPSLVSQATPIKMEFPRY